MEIIIKTKDLKLTSGLEAFINQKITRLKKLLPENSLRKIEIELGLVTLRKQKGDIYSAKIMVLEPRGKLLRAYAEEETIKTAIVKAREDIQAQLTKFKERLESERKKQIKTKQKEI
ncbi:MAG: ribosome-associated translation inhibitor RaiA [Candidatus Paceibacterota bacterium]|jgi:ribosomal subunit interface protein